MSIEQALAKALHDERAEKDTRNVDCWACEAGKSEAIAMLLAELRKAQSVASHANAMLARAVPDSDALHAMWREHWVDQLEFRRRRGETGRPAEGLPAYSAPAPSSAQGAGAEEADRGDV